MEKGPLVSVLLLSMNHEKFITQCMQSVLDQEYDCLEIIYLDNASHDNTYSTGKSFLEKSALPFKSFANKESKGVSENLNFLLEKASGEFVIILSTDDWWHKNNLNEKLNFFSDNPGCGMVYSDGYFYYKDGTTSLFSGQDKFCSGQVLGELLSYNFIKCPSVMLRKSLLDEVGLFDENLLIEDWDFWIRAAEKTPFGFINTPLVYYRYSHGGNLSSKQAFIVKAVNQMIEKYKTRYPIQMALLRKKNILREANYRVLTPVNGRGLLWFMSNIQFTPGYLKTIIKYIFWKKSVANS